MKTLDHSHWHRSIGRLFCSLACLFPSLLLAHPGHYHPDETDEFDFFKATFLHSHGTLDYLIAGIVVSSLALVFLHKRTKVRIAAVIVATGSLALMPTL